MQSFNYHQTPEGIHVIDSKETKSGVIAIDDVTEMLQEIQHNAFGKPGLRRVKFRITLSPAFA